MNSINAGTSRARRFFSGVLEIMETAVLTSIAILMLIFVFVLMVIGLLYLMPRYPQIPSSWFWPIIWIVMGLIVVNLAGLLWWWGRAIKAREEIDRLVD